MSLFRSCLPCVFLFPLAGCSEEAPRSIRTNSEPAVSRAEAFAEMAQDKTETLVAPKPVSPEEIKALILQLRSPNRPTNPEHEPISIEFPADYDLAAQEKVQEAWDNLVALGKQAFPALIQHMQDREYCLSYETSLLRDFCVGEVCRQIIEGQVDLATVGYKSRPGVDGTWHQCPHYFEQFYQGKQTPREMMQQWWQDHQHLSLREMQIAALRYRIEQEQQIGFPTYPDKQTFLYPLYEQWNQLLVENVLEDYSEAVLNQHPGRSNP